MDAFDLFIPLQKVDIEKRLVYGVATAEAPDRSGEIMDYASTKPYFEKWSSDMAKATDGKSLGNVRVMHGSIAAGKLTEINFNDEEKRISVCAKVVDDDEWKKVTEGVYTGFSQGGKYIKRWKDEETNLVRFTAEPHEISLVDLPCLPEATFTAIKADGSAEMRKFKTVEAVEETPVIEEEVVETVEKLAEENVEETTVVEETVVDTVVATDEVIEAEKSAGTDLIEPKQVWFDGEMNHDTKKAAISAIKSRKIAAEVEKLAGPAQDALMDLVEKFGLEKKDFTAAERRKAAASGHAMKDGSFPINNVQDLENAVHDVGRAHDPDAAKAHIIARAKALGATDKLPADWKGSTNKDATETDDLVKVVIEEVVKSAAPSDSHDAAMHASMTHFHAHQAMGDKADMHKSAAVAHADAYLAQANGAEDKMMKSDMAWDETCKCYGMGKDGAAKEMQKIISEGGESFEKMVADLPEIDRPAFAKHFKSDVVVEVETLPLGSLDHVVKAIEVAITERKDPEFEKSGARNNKSDQARVQTVHDLAKELGAGCEMEAEKTVVADDLNKVIDIDDKDEIIKGLSQKLGVLEENIIKLAGMYEVIANQPQPAKAAIFAVQTANSEVSTQADLEKKFADLMSKMTQDERAHYLTKLAMMNPKPYGR